VASQIYPNYLEAVIQGSTNSSLTGTVKAAIVDTGVESFNTADDMYDDISSGVVGTPATLASKTYTDGVFDAADITGYAYGGGAAPTGEAIVIYIDTGTPSTSRLVAWIDGFTAIPAGVDTVNITWGAYIIDFN
jgi:hypothetical protein